MPIENSTYRILVVEDNPGDYTLIEEFLFEQIETPIILLAQSFKETQQICSTHQGLDVILLDLSLPDKKGEPLIEELIGICPNIPVIVLTGYADFKFGIKSLSLGVTDYLLKDDLNSLSLYKSIAYSVERKKNSFALEISEKKYSELFHSSPVPMWIFDLFSLQFLDVNKAAVTHYGYSKQEFLAMTIFDIRPADELTVLNKIITDYRSQRIFKYQRIFTHAKKNGTVIKVDVQSNIIEFKGKQALVTMANDITERLAYVKAIEEQNEKLREIAWIQSHIVRAPLARIMGLVQLFKMAKIKADEAESETMLTYLGEAADELDDMIKKITDKTRIEDF
jgi:PAS domain S-box-containing protein